MCNVRIPDNNLSLNDTGMYSYVYLSYNFDVLVSKDFPYVTPWNERCWKGCNVVSTYMINIYMFNYRKTTT